MQYGRSGAVSYSRQRMHITQVQRRNRPCGYVRAPETRKEAFVPARPGQLRLPVEVEVDFAARGQETQRRKVTVPV